MAPDLRAPAPALVACVSAAVSLCGAILAGCTRSDAPAGSTTARVDSAGVEIVHSPMAGSHVSAWSVGDEPAVSIGSLEGDPETSFGYIAGALILPDGRYLVGDMQTTEVRVFSSAGDYLETWGRQGEGPGEYGTVWWLGRYRGDSILVGEIAARRVTVLDRDGTFGRILTPRVTPFSGPFDQVRPSQSCCQLKGALSDGSLVIAHPEMIPVRPSPPRASTMAVIRVSADGSVEDTISVLPGATYHPVQPLSRPSHFATRPLVAPFGEAVYVTDGRDYSISVLDPSGVTLRIIRTDAAPQPVTDPLKEQLEEVLAGLRAESDESHAEGMERMMAQPYPETLPAVTRLLVDATGKLWVGHAQVYGVGGSSDYEVFDSSGELVAVVRMPPDLRLVDASADQLVGVWTDEFDVQYLHAYAIHRQP